MKRLTLTALSLIICLNDNLYSSETYVEKDDKHNLQKSLSHIDDSDDIDFHHISSVPDFALTEFTSDNHKTLKIGILNKDNILFECLDPKILSDIEPSIFRPLSGRNFLSIAE